MTVVNPKSISGINSITTGSDSDNLLTIHTSDASNTERVRINSSGDVIVGSGITVSPDGDIFATGVTTSTTFVGALTGNVTGNVTGNISGGTVAGSTGTFTGDVDIADKIVHTGDTNNAIRFPEADNISLETGGSERLRLNNQYLIKGHTTVYPIAGHYPSVQLTGTTFNDATLSLINNANDATGSYIYLSKQRSGSQGGATVVQDDDLVGQIGWTAGDGTDVTSRIAEIKGEIDGTPGSNDTPGRLSFWTTADGAQSATERLRIDSSGRVMIGSGTYIGGAALAVLGTGNTPNAYGSLAIGKVGANPTSGTTLANIRLNGGSVGTGRGAEINAIADANWSDGSSHPTYLTFSTVASSSTSATERIRVHAGGNVDIKTGSLVISTAGQGIDFSAAGGSSSGSVSALLDDYEEGTCVPTQGNGSFSPSSADGKYTKVGRLVTWMMHVVFDSTSSTNHLQIGNFPFTAGGGRAGAGIVRYSNDDEAYEISFHVDGGGATATAYYLNGGGIVQSQAVSAKRYDITFVYEAAS